MWLVHSIMLVDRAGLLHHIRFGWNTHPEPLIRQLPDA